MGKRKYNIRYLPTFINQFNNILYYIKYDLKNEIAAENLYNEVIEKIEARSEYPTAFEVFKKTRKEDINWYRIQIRNYTVFYVVENEIMEVRRIYYCKRNLDKLI